MTDIPGKTGVVYTLDPATGEFLGATPTVVQNVISNIDGATGVVSENPELIFGGFGQEVLTCPTAMDGKGLRVRIRISNSQAHPRFIEKTAI